MPKAGVSRIRIAPKPLDLTRYSSFSNPCQISLHSTTLTHSVFSSSLCEFLIFRWLNHYLLLITYPIIYHSYKFFLDTLNSSSLLESFLYSEPLPKPCSLSIFMYWTWIMILQIQISVENGLGKVLFQRVWQIKMLFFCHFFWIFVLLTCCLRN